MLKSLKSINLFFFILSAAILLTIALAWALYPMEIHWLGIQSRTGFSASVIMKNFNVLMNYLINPFQWVLKMPQFPSSKNGLHHFEAVKYLFHLVTWLFDPRVDSIILALPEDYFMHAFLIFFVLYEGICASFYLLSRRTK